MAENKIVGYKNIFGFVLPDWVDEGLIRLFVTILFSSAAMLFVLIFIVWPRFAVISELNGSLKVGEETLSLLKESKVGFDGLNSKIPETLQDLVLSSIPQTYSPENAIFMLRKLSSETPGMSIVSYRLPAGVLFETKGKVEKGSAGKEIVSFISFPIRLTVTAPVESLLLFINKVETSLPFGVVSVLGMQEVTKLAKSTTSKSVQMEIEIKYFQASLREADISKIKPVSSTDLAVVKKLGEYSRLGTFGTADLGPINEASGSSEGLFGF